MLSTASRFALLAAFGLAWIAAVSGCASAADGPVGAAGAARLFVPLAADGHEGH